METKKERNPTNMKKIFLTAFLTLTACVLAVHVLAASGMIQISVDPSIKILVNGSEFKPKDVNGKDVMTFVYQGTTYAPLRALAEAYGLEVGYDANLKMATVSEPAAKPAETKPAETEPKPSAEPTNKYTAGQYKIGKDMPAGEYALFPSKRGDDGYFCCTTDANGDDIINNDHFSTYSIYKVQNGEYLELSRCYAVPLAQAEIPDTDYTDGTYIVGTHIPAGEYKVTSIVEDRSGYYCVYSDLFRDDIVSNDYFEGSVYVSLSQGDVLVLERCQVIVD